MQLLLIESSKSYSNLFQKLLENSGVTLTLASSIEQALSCIKTRSYDVIYSSATFGDDSVKSFCQQLREIPNYQTTPCIVYAANVSQERTDAYLSSGATELVGKAELIENLLEHIKKQQSTTTLFNIVHIEDDRVMQILMKNYLARIDGIQLSQFVLGKEGIAYINEHCPDVLLLDMNLPDSNGWEIATELRQANQTKNLPIVAITGEIALNNHQEGSTELFTEIIKKPFDQGTIEEIISRFR